VRPLPRRTEPRSEAPAHRGGQHVKATCMGCHDEGNCAFCHAETERAAFDHAVQGGWSLEPHHAKVPCSACHGSAGNFTVPTRACHSCHASRPAGKVDAGAVHAALGQEAASPTACRATRTSRIASRTPSMFMVRRPTMRAA